MSIKTKKAGAYADIVGVFHKRAGAYNAVQGVFVKSAGAYGRVDGGGGVAGLVALMKAKDYVSGQRWLNAAASPADGSNQVDHDFFLGATSSSEASDPSISAGPPVGWAFSSGCRMTLAHGSVSTVPAFYRNLHMAGSKFTIMAYCRWNGSLNGGICPIFDTGTSDQGGADMSRGVYLCDFGTDGKLRLKVNRDSGGASALSAVSDAALPSATNMVIGVSVDGTGATPSFLYRDGAQPVVGGSPTFNGSFVTPGSAQAANVPKLMARGDGNATTNVVTLYGLAVANRNLSLAEMDQVRALLMA